MKNYYLSIREKGKRWSDVPQKNIQAPDWEELVRKVKLITNTLKKEIRISTSNGYNNQGYYFNDEGIKTNNDLFDIIEYLPDNIQEIINSYDDNKSLYKECERVLKELEPLGYTYKYGLSGEPFELQKIENSLIKKEKALIEKTSILDVQEDSAKKNKGIKNSN